MLLSTGERICCALCAMAINDLGHKAISLTGSQAGIVTDSSHTKARIIDVRADRIREALEEDSIVLVAGFQGVSTDSRDVTTLGRGGSDTTAVALAAALGGEVCEIYTDVAGVFSADPRIVPDARKLPVVSYEEMLEMAASGAKVLQLRSVEYARNHGVRIHCRSSIEDGPGTLVVSEQETMERPLVTAVTHSTDEARVTLTGVRDEPGVAGRDLRRARRRQRQRRHDHPERARLRRRRRRPLVHGRARRPARPRSRRSRGWSAAEERRRPTTQIGKVSIVGAGMRSHPGVAAKVFRPSASEGINIEMISTSPIKISCVIARRAGARRREGAAPGVRAGRGRGPRGGPDRRASTARRSRPSSAILRSMPERTTESESSAPPAPSARRSSRCSPSGTSPPREVVPFASERSAGKKVDFNGSSSSAGR